MADQLADIARQGSGMARLAHVCASLMLVLFSAGSLVALGGDALLSVLDGAQQGHVDLPAAISLGSEHAAGAVYGCGDALCRLDAATCWGCDELSRAPCDCIVA